ncbi:diacylglycerol kinase [Helicobacter cetorum]|uniref:Diacylglycerol kinase n=1 Tax=Helicobacter cetorum (strain ATCC BAA-429 / MIT 00-7128) TaxID=182217 RepID=I0EMJ4_HELC0|nr:diacylglycerol kinase [Helicobacter cetorum]AFI04163.1 diacylglycerol kinase [Helicobacter cetorum MIT 00-7128]
MNTTPPIKPPKAKGIKRIIKAFFYSKDGLKCAWVEESAFRQVLILALICIILASYITKDFLEWGLLILPCFLSVVIELLNSSIEKAVDYTGTEFHPLAKKAKDIASSAQLIGLIFWAFIWGRYLFCALSK